MAFSWSSKVCRVKISFLLGNVGTFPRNAILMGDKISWRSLLQRTFQVSAAILPLLPASSITHDMIIKLANGMKITSLSDIFNARVNDLSKEAILQCINDGDLRFLSVIEIMIKPSLSNSWLHFQWNFGFWTSLIKDANSNSLLTLRFFIANIFSPNSCCSGIFVSSQNIKILLEISKLSSRYEYSVLKTSKLYQ